MALGNGGLGTNSVLDAIIHPDMHGSLRRMYPSYFTVQVVTQTKAEDHSLAEEWTDVPHLRGMRGILAAATAEEKRTAMLTNTRITHVLDLQSYHPEIGNDTHRVIASRAMGESGETFNITGVKHDSQARSSRLELEYVSH